MISIGLEVRFDQASTALAASPLLEAADELSDVRLAEVLVQRRLVSLAFTPFYDMLIDALVSPTARLVCRQILREEYPDPAGNSPSHRELLVQDLVALGIDREAVLRARPTAATADIILGSFELLFAAMRAPFRELVLIATAACYGELLVAAEYRALQPRIIAGLGQEPSVFYIPHLAHDSGHAKRLLEEIALRLDPDSPEQADGCAAAIGRCLALKLAFYAQFAETVPWRLKRQGRVAACRSDGGHPAGDGSRAKKSARGPGRGLALPRARRRAASRSRSSIRSRIIRLVRRRGPGTHWNGIEKVARTAARGAPPPAVHDEQSLLIGDDPGVDEVRAGHPRGADEEQRWRRA